MFCEEKVAHLAAYLLLRHDRQMPYIKLLKLLYLSERQAMAKWGFPMSGDRFVSMKNGPVLSNTYNLILERQDGITWKSLIARSEYDVSLKQDLSVDDLDELSKSEMKILDQTFEEFGHMAKFALVDYTHDNCEEWVEPNSSSYPIHHNDIFKALGIADEQASALTEKAREVNALDMMRVTLR